MTNFLIKVLSFLLAMLFLFSLLYLTPQKETYQSEFLKGMVDKHARLDSLPSPKLILAGGSNLAFGIESKQLEEAFSIPVVNLAINAALGRSFILEELKHSIQSGDIVFLSLEYFIGDGVEIIRTKASNAFPQAFNYYDIETYNIIKMQLDYIKTNLKTQIRDFVIKLRGNTQQLKQKDTVYTKNAFNKYGDVVSHYGKSGKKQIPMHYLLYRYWEGISELNELKQYADTKGVNIFYFYPTCSSTYYNNNKKVISLLQRDLDNDLLLNIINEPSDFVYDDSLFFDTVYHLKKEGGEKRTKKIINLIKNNPKANQIIKYKGVSNK